LRDVYKKFAVECYNVEHGVSLITMQNCLYRIFQSNQNVFVQHVYRKLTVGADGNEQLLRQMPKDYWLRGCPTKCLLACMVHQCNKEITTSCSSLPAGQSREVLRNNAAARFLLNMLLRRKLARNKMMKTIGSEGFMQTLAK
jgi:hypothetical protein